MRGPEAKDQLTKLADVFSARLDVQDRDTISFAYERNVLPHRFTVRRGAAGRFHPNDSFSANRRRPSELQWLCQVKQKRAMLGCILRDSLAGLSGR
jgi:hypothetical protein